MLQEIERKFLVNQLLDLTGIAPVFISQGYISRSPLCTVRVRIMGDRGYITVKGHTEGISRTEYEYEIPCAEALSLLNHYALTPAVEKFRYVVQVGNHRWEVDLFQGANQGLTVAEVELGAEEELFERPVWIEQEVSHDERYRNSNLAIHPYTQWERENRG